MCGLKHRNRRLFVGVLWPFRVVSRVFPRISWSLSGHFFALALRFATNLKSLSSFRNFYFLFRSRSGAVRVGGRFSRVEGQRMTGFLGVGWAYM